MVIIVKVSAPGAHGLPLAAALAKTGKYDAVIARLFAGTSTLNIPLVVATAWHAAQTAKSGF